MLLSGHAVSYALSQHPAPALSFGAWTQAHPADIGNELRSLVAAGVPVSVVEDDLTARGLGAKECLAGIQRIARSDLAALYDSVDQVWQW